MTAIATTTTNTSTTMTTNTTNITDTVTTMTTTMTATTLALATTTMTTDLNTMTNNNNNNNNNNSHNNNNNQNNFINNEEDASKNPIQTQTETHTETEAESKTETHSDAKKKNLKTALTAPNNGKNKEKEIFLLKNSSSIIDNTDTTNTNNTHTNTTTTILENTNTITNTNTNINTNTNTSINNLNLNNLDTETQRNLNLVCKPPGLLDNNCTLSNCSLSSLAQPNNCLDSHALMPKPENITTTTSASSLENSCLRQRLVELYLDTESYKLIQKLTINNPFYRFHKQSNSLREKTAKSTSTFMHLRKMRKFKSDTDLIQQPRAELEATAFTTSNCNNINNKNNIIVLAQTNKISRNCLKSRNQKIDLKFSRQQFKHLQASAAAKNNSEAHGLNDLMAMKPNDFNNSTVITNPFSIFHDDESQLTLTVDKRLRCASSASRRMLRKPTVTTAATAAVGTTSSTSSGGSVTLLQQPRPFASQQQLNNYHYLYGVPIKKFERQDFPPNLQQTDASNDQISNNRAKSKSKITTSTSSSSVFKQIALRKGSKTSSASSSNINVPLTGPHLKRLKITYPNHTQPCVNGSKTTHNNYFSRLQAKTKQGLQKLKDKCKQFNTLGTPRNHLTRHHTTSSFKSMAKVESFRFINDKDNIRNYETRCMAAYHQDHKQKPGTLYKSYKSELDLSKNLHYLEAYLNQNFEQSNNQAQSVGRAQGQKIRRAFHQVHKRCGSNHSQTEHMKETAKNFKNNYENVPNLPYTKSESFSSSDYASVFSANCTEPGQKEDQTKNQKTDYYQTNVTTAAKNDSGSLRYEHPKMSDFKRKKCLSPDPSSQEKTQSVDLVNQTKNVEEDEEQELDEEVTELIFKKELLGLYPHKDSSYFDSEFPLEIPEDEEDDFASSNIRILINNSEHFERSPEEDWYMQRSEADNLSEVAFYQSLNEQLQQQHLFEEQQQLNYDPFIAHLKAELYPFHSETEEEKQLISSSSSLQRQQRPGNNLKYDYENKIKTESADYKCSLDNAIHMQSLYKTYQNKTTLSNSSSSTSSINLQQNCASNSTAANNHLMHPNHQMKYKINALKPTNNQPTFNPPRRTSTSSSDNFDTFISNRSAYQPAQLQASQQKIPSKRSSFSHYAQQQHQQQRSPLSSQPPQPQMNVLNYYGVAHSSDTYSIPFKLQSSSSSSNHSSKLSNSSSNSTTSSNHTNPLITQTPPVTCTQHMGSLMGLSAPTAIQINLNKLYNNQNVAPTAVTDHNSTSSSNTIITNLVTPQTLLYNPEKRDKFILEYEC
ncbi:hypothetical protein DOY81_008400 [Sarcophaga bullata]|nr:hypothetical protein DOY81_008400 [Sarcophaga bullata]